MYKKDRHTITCKFCFNPHLTGDKRTKYCSISCYNKDTKSKGVDGYKKCLMCTKQMPYRKTLKIRSYKNIASIKTKFCSNKCKNSWQNKFNNPMKRIACRKKVATKARKRDISHLHTPEAIKKRAQSISGKNHWNWQGGKTSENRRRRNLAEYQVWRKTVFERDDYTCQMCSKRGANLEADHIKPWAYFPELRLDVDNGRTLCKKCHEKTPTYKTGANKLYGLVER